MFFGLSLRQFIFSVLACGVAMGLYFLLRPRFGTETLSWVCILGAFPFAAMGFIKYNGMTAEQFVWAWLKSEFLMPKKLMFLPDNLYYETVKPTIEAYEKGLTTVRKKQKGRTPKPKKSKKKKAKCSKEVNNAGVAMQSELIVVKLGNPIQEGFPRTTELMMGIDYIIRKALELRMPVAVNISFGNTYGGHDGTTLLERYIDDVSNIWKSVFCIGTGNEAASAGHTSGRIISEGEETIQLAIQSRQSSISIQIWKEYTDQIEISIINPSGVRVGPVPEILGPHRFRIGQTEILLYYGEPSPYSISQEIYIDLLPVESYLTEGIWRIVLSAGKIVTGQYEMWLPSDNVLNRGTGFLFPTDATTLTIPSSASRAISVGAYDARTFAYADFSGRGFTRLTNMVKPDLVAPGVEVMTTTVGGGYAAFTGTSFATPFVTGSAALLMEWGIVRGNDPYLYGEKVKAYLRRGAKKVPGFDEYPNEEVGYGEDVIIRLH